MANLNNGKIKFVKAVYGNAAMENNQEVTFGTEKITAWQIVGIDTVQALEEKFSEAEILTKYEQYQSAM